MFTERSIKTQTSRRFYGALRLMKGGVYGWSAHRKDRSADRGPSVRIGNRRFFINLGTKEE